MDLKIAMDSKESSCARRNHDLFTRLTQSGRQAGETRTIRSKILRDRHGWIPWAYSKEKRCGIFTFPPRKLCSTCWVVDYVRLDLRMWKFKPPRTKLRSLGTRLLRSQHMSPFADNLLVIDTEEASEVCNKIFICSRGSHFWQSKS